jgi:hypothetical protein
VLIQGQIGVQNQVEGSNPITARFGRDADLMVSEMRGRYAEATFRGRGFHVAAQAVLTSTVGLATAYTGLVLSNPVASGYMCEINFVSIMQSVLQSTQIEAFALAVGFNATTNVTHTTPQAILSTRIGSGLASNMRADVSATLPTAPTYAMFLQNTATATANGPGVTVDLGGSIMLPPGAYAAIVTPAQASVAGMWYSFQWQEYAQLP